MKNSFFGVLLLSAGTLSAQAQISAGTKLLTGSIGYSQQKTETDGVFNHSTENKFRQFNFSSNAGYFVAENLALGVQVGAFSRKSESLSTDNISGNSSINGFRERTLSGGVFGRYYKFIGEKVALYGQLGGGYQNVYSSNRLAVGPPSSTNNRRKQGFYGGLLPGIVFFPTNKLGLELTLRGLSYNSLTERVENGSQDIKITDQTLDFGFGLNDLNLGISLYLGRN
ncbi:outer membrane beta-barrel protein [Hymenobacter lapidiphilus]|uniref:Outer membrane protein beta-barrel domain-containing protein n=1 Tax=Hymenobacter lapidiphilus TaxID=2608003 RepID=A0A7Y7U779_9BACT|nr:outer membrane beta-barrel protein [Hymenobacter lapidiphilus]NVO32235.1 hypothetical protein [Hymenobacter lapidiphilus]